MFHVLSLRSCITADNFTNMLNQRHLINWVGAMTIVCEISDTPKKKLANPKPKLELFSEAQRRGLAAHKTVWPQAVPTRGWHQAAAAACRHRQNAYPACLLASPCRHKQAEGGNAYPGMPAPLCLARRPLCSGQSGPLQQLWRNPPIKGYSHGVWTVQWNLTQHIALISNFFRKLNVWLGCVFKWLDI